MIYDPGMPLAWQSLQCWDPLSFEQIEPYGKGIGAITEHRLIKVSKAGNGALDLLVESLFSIDD